MNILKVFDNIKLPFKMLLIGMLALIGIAIPTYYYMQISVGSQAASATELKGVKPTSSIVILKKLTAEHRGMTAQFLGGNTSIESALNAKAREVDAQFSAISSAVSRALNNANLEDPKFTRYLDQVKSEWESVRTNVRNGSLSRQAAFVAHSDLINSQDALISDLLKTFLLSYDPSASSYHTIIATYINLPRLSNALGKVRGSSAGALALGQVAPATKSTIQAYISGVEEPARDFAYNLEAAGEADDRFKALASKAVSISKDVNMLLDLVRNQVLIEGPLSYDSNQMFQQYSIAIGELYEIHDESIILLTKVIEERVSGETAARTKTLTIIGSLVIVSFFIGFIIIRSITHSANKLIEVFESLGKQIYDISFNINRKDEMGILEKGLAQLTDQLKEASVIAIEASKVKQALDSSSMCFMMSNESREIVYMNESFNTLMQESESEIKKTLPQFDSRKLTGTKIDNFDQQILNRLADTNAVQLVLGDKSFKLNINPIRDSEGKDLGNSIEWLDMTEIYEEEKRVKRILEALNSSSTNIMLANAQSEVIYMNRSMQNTMKQAEADLRQELPDFKSSEVIGGSIDKFHANTNHQANFFDSLTDTYVAENSVGERHFKLTANPIFSDDEERIGTVVEWLDRTKEVNAEREINDMVSASLRGDFTKRIDEESKDGFLKIMSEGLNELIRTTESGLNEVSNVLLAISQGDLTKRITSDYQGTFNDLKNYSNSTSDNLAAVISKIREASETINNASSEIAQGNSDLSTRTEQQASSLEETASSMEEITSTVRLNAENANQANGLASQASQVATNGGNLIQEVVVTMASINESSQKISDIIGVIDGIAFQTNILALNAAVEAARAGEQGRGFAVVASEVRTLAQRSANAAKDIKDLISDSVNKVESGNDLVAQSGETMKEIVTSIQRVNDIMSEIAAASAEQASGIDEVSKAVTQMDEMTQQNAALVEEAAAAAESMRNQAGELNDRVGTFKLNENDVVVTMPPPKQSAQTHKLPNMPVNADPLSQQFDELPSVLGSSNDDASEDDEWESF